MRRFFGKPLSSAIDNFVVAMTRNVAVAAMAIGAVGLVKTAVGAAAQSTTAPQSKATASELSPPIHQYEGLELSPDGKRIASIESTLDPSSEGVPRGPVIVRDAASGHMIEQFDPCSQCLYTSPTWSADGKHLAFLASDEAAGSVQIVVAPDAGRGAWRDHARSDGRSKRRASLVTLANISGVANTLRWSPDGRMLAVLATVSAKKKTGALEAGAPQVGEIGSDPDEQRIAIVRSEQPNALRLVSPADTFVYEYDWAPDGTGFVATAAKGDGDNNWWVAELASIELASGALRTIARPAFQVSIPRVSPDGKTVTFIGGLMSDFGVTGGDIYEVPLAGGTPVNRTPQFRGSFTSLVWRQRKLYAGAIVVDRSVLMRFDAGQVAPTMLWSAPMSAQAGDMLISISADGRTGATVVQDFGSAPKIMAGKLGGAGGDARDSMRAVTTDNDALSVPLDVRSVQWKSDGYDVQGWLVGPSAAPDSDRRYPMLVHVHGGPSSAVMPTFGRDYSFYTTVHEWAKRGYYIFMPNPRGSYGQGAAFGRANVRDFGGGDLRDILAGVDAVLKVAPVDGERLGLHGHSYGGFMAMWGVTHSNRFKAAVAGAGLSNWISYYGENGIDQWMIPFFGKSAYDDPAIYRQASPIESIKNSKTPTLIYVGELDVECPAAQSLEFWHGLKAMGVPTQLMIYPGEGHLIRRAEHVSDLRRRVPEWFDRYLKP